MMEVRIMKATTLIVGFLFPAPSHAIESVRVVPITTTSVRVDWIPINVASEDAWSGDSKGGGYRVFYRPTSDFPAPPPSPTPSKEVKGTDGLQRDVTYEVWVLAFNSQGEGPPSSPPSSVYVGEAVPTGEPKALKAIALAPTEVGLEWEAPQPSTRNGELLGYKIYYIVVDAPNKRRRLKVKNSGKKIGGKQVRNVLITDPASPGAVDNSFLEVSFIT
ncbi:hypothetical protein J437_LFUL007933 [Ladona fulva]|uniref:Fibronectin type-III domain-containing protein n=1 Tax=Ladona fulva TaxID=123851 RepID=A0A8K0KB71_LADFU|nr:hypothetical protein J437_LFUL007933 [Ladona fulva]